MSRINITYIVSDIDKALAFEWIATYLDKEKFNLSFIILNPGNSQLESFLIKEKIEVYRVICRGKKDWPKAIWQTRKLLKKIKTTIVHCHLLQANIIGLMAAKLAGLKERIYTRHHSSFHHVYYKKGIWWDKLANKLATRIVAISGVVKKILIELEKVPIEKVVLIPHGFLLEQFIEVSDERVKEFRLRHSLNSSKPIVGVISRFTELKGIQYIIPAFKSLLNEFPDAILIMLNAKGDFEKEILTLLKALPEKNYRLTDFEADIASAYHCMDVFVHVPIDEHSEAFGQIYVESMAAGVPSVFTLSGIAPEFIKNNENALVVPYKDSNAIYVSITQILRDESLKDRLKLNGYKSVQKLFGLDLMINKLEQLYAE